MPKKVELSISLDDNKKLTPRQVKNKKEKIREKLENNEYYKKGFWSKNEYDYEWLSNFIPIEHKINEIFDIEMGKKPKLTKEEIKEIDKVHEEINSRKMSGLKRKKKKQK